MTLYPFSHVPGKRSQFDLFEPLLTEAIAFDSVWYKRDFASTLEYHLGKQIPLAGSVGNSKTEGGDDCSPIRVGPLLLSSHPSVDHLRVVKDYAKRLRDRAQSDRLKQVATVLYFACIAVAELRANTVITTLSRTVIQEGYRWAWRMSWPHFPVSYIFEGVIALQDHCATRSGGGP